MILPFGGTGFPAGSSPPLQKDVVQRQAVTPEVPKNIDHLNSQPLVTESQKLDGFNEVTWL